MMFRYILAAFVILAAIGCSKSLSSNHQIKTITSDLYIETLADSEVQLLKLGATGTEDCLDHLKRVSCVSMSSAAAFDPNCSVSDVTPEMLGKMPELMALLPRAHYQVFCHLDRLQIQPQLSAIGYATGIHDANGKLIGTMIGVRADAIEGHAVMTDVFSWKEQLNFGLSRKDDKDHVAVANGPHVIEEIPGTDIPLVLHTLVHELTHLIDFLNLANRPINETIGSSHVTTQQPGSFALLSWPPQLTETAELPNFWKEWQVMQPELSKLCYYSCLEPTPVSEIAKVYRDLQKSSFMTAYSADAFEEDFAESSTVFLLRKLGFKYKIVNGDGSVLFDLEASWNSGALSLKKLWLDSFYKRPDLIFEL